MLTSAKKDGQPIIHADTGSRRLLHRRCVRRSSSSSEVSGVIEEGRIGDHPRLHRGSRRSFTSSEKRHRESPTPTEPGCRISCYFDFSSLQSRIVSVFPSRIGSVWVCFDTEVQSEWIFVDRGSRRASTSTDGRRRLETSTAENPREDLHRRSVTAGLTHQRERIKETIFIGS